MNYCMNNYAIITVSEVAFDWVWKLKFYTEKINMKCPLLVRLKDFFFF